MSAHPAPIVVALGGHAISPAGEPESIQNQFRQTRRSAVVLADLLESDAPVVITHGNGPQIGHAVRRIELAAHEVYEIPLGICVADLQGGMGYMITQCINNELRRRGCTRTVTTIVTSVEVDADDPAFAHPTKPIGPYYAEDRAARLRAGGWRLVHVPQRGYRRVVPSPQPKAILEIGLIRRLVEAGEAVVAVGGGGVPVCRDEAGELSGREAVVDKDLASGLLAREIGAEILLNVTGVERVCLDFGTLHQRELKHLTTTEAGRYLEEGHFPPGSLGPKIQATLAFLADAPDGARVIITDVDHMADALAGRAGTTITRG